MAEKVVTRTVEGDYLPGVPDHLCGAVVSRNYLASWLARQVFEQGEPGDRITVEVRIEKKKLT